MKLLKIVCLIAALFALVGSPGCAKQAAESGGAEVSGGAGGEGSGPTGTGGGEPADNPAPNSNGTGGP
jgi:hypothetical protein